MSTLGALLAQRFRRDRWTVAIWLVCTGLLAAFAAAAIGDEYGDDADRAAILRLAVANPAILIVRGLPNGASIGQFTFFQIFTYLALMAALMSTFLAVRHSRAEEEVGRAELIASTRAGRITPTVATLIHGILANLALGLLVALGFLSSGLDVAGSVFTGVATASVGITFACVGLLVAQFQRSARAANSTLVALVLAAFFLRGIGDSLGTPSADGLHLTSSWASWLSPIGWAQHVGAFAENDPSPLLLNLALAAVAIAVVFALQSRRDTGASLLPERAGRRDARATLSSTFALALRLQRTTIVAWAVGGAACGFFAGTLSQLVREASESTPAVGDALSEISTSAGTLDQALISVMLTLVGVLASASAIQAVIRAHQEEQNGTAELLLSTPTSRVRWFVEYLVVGAIAIAVVLVSAAVVAVLGVVASGSPGSQIGDSVAAAAAQVPASLLFLGLLALVFTLVPRLTTALGWSLLGVTMFLGVFGPLVGIPEWLRDLSPFTHTPQPFGDDIDWSGGVAMLALALLTAGAATLVMRQRALATG